MAHKILSSLLVGAAVLALSCSAQARDGYDAMEDQLLQNGSTGAQPQGFGPGPARDGWRAHDHWERHHDEGRWGHQSLTRTKTSGAMSGPCVLMWAQLS